jgi:hypothetical protein
MLRDLPFGDRIFLKILLTHHPEILDEIDENASAPHSAVNRSIESDTSMPH